MVKVVTNSGYTELLMNVVVKLKYQENGYGKNNRNIIE